MKLIKYFAYGHNTNLTELQQRVPDAMLVGAAVLHNWRFDLERLGNIVPQQGSTVHGVLWNIPRDQLDQLDWDEAYGRHYGHRMVTVQFRKQPVAALTYVMLPGYRDPEPPSRQYIEWIADGYRDNRIPLAQLITALENRLQDFAHHK